MAYGLWDQINGIATKVKRLCCAVENLYKQTAAASTANPCYLEITIITGGAFPYTSLADYNANTTWSTPFTGLVTLGDSQRLYGGSNVNLANIFQNNGNVTSINDGCGVVTGLQDNSFDSASVLSYINLPSVVSIPTQAFFSTALTYFNLPLVNSVEDSAFEDCTSLQSINFPLLTTAGNASFRNCTSVTSINLPLLEFVDQGCFTNVNSFAGVLNLPELLSAPQFSFNSMTNCTGYNFPKAVTTGANCFFDSCLAATGTVTFDLRSCIDLGGTVGNDQIWDTLSGKVVNLTIPSILMTCNSGNPDGDILQLISPGQGNTVNITIV